MFIYFFLICNKLYWHAVDNIGKTKNELPNPGICKRFNF